MLALYETGVRPTHPVITQQDIRELDQLSEVAPSRALRYSLSLVRRLAGEFAARVSGRPPEAISWAQENGPQIVHHVAGRGDRWWLGYFLWLPGAATPIHDHTSWGIYSCVSGTLLEERYRRLDDEAQPNQAHLRLRWQRRWNQGQSSGLLPYAGGIHRVANQSLRPAWSVHLYGPRLGEFDGRDYDPARDYVCDRQER